METVVRGWLRPPVLFGLHPLRFHRTRSPSSFRLSSSVRFIAITLSPLLFPHPDRLGLFLLPVGKLRSSVECPGILAETGGVGQTEEIDGRVSRCAPT